VTHVEGGLSHGTPSAPIRIYELLGEHFRRGRRTLTRFGGEVEQDGVEWVPGPRFNVLAEYQIVSETVHRMSGFDATHQAHVEVDDGEPDPA